MKRGRGGGVSSIVKVPGDVTPTRGYTFRTSCLAKSILFGNLSLDKSTVCFLAILAKEKSNFGNLCTETQNFDDLLQRRQKFCNFGPENVNLWHF